MDVLKCGAVTRTPEEAGKEARDNLRAGGSYLLAQMLEQVQRGVVEKQLTEVRRRPVGGVQGSNQV
jgi:hypothetical protein